jgi:hypothetical protein
VKLGHREVNGEFWFQKKTAVAARCVLCGLDDHEISTCVHYVSARHEFEASSRHAALNPNINATGGSSQDLNETLNPDNSIITIHPAPDTRLLINIVIPASGYGPLPQNLFRLRNHSTTGNSNLQVQAIPKVSSSIQKHILVEGTFSGCGELSPDGKTYIIRGSLSNVVTNTDSDNSKFRFYTEGVTVRKPEVEDEEGDTVDEELSNDEDGVEGMEIDG